MTKKGEKRGREKKKKKGGKRKGGKGLRQCGGCGLQNQCFSTIFVPREGWSGRDWTESQVERNQASQFASEARL
jgi:hypothetical protein